jgi:hypothetical protein
VLPQVATLLPDKAAFKYADLIYLENYRFSRLALQVGGPSSGPQAPGLGPPAASASTPARPLLRWGSSARGCPGADSCSASLPLLPPALTHALAQAIFQSLPMLVVLVYLGVRQLQGPEPWLQPGDWATLALLAQSAVAHLLNLADKGAMLAVARRKGGAGPLQLLGYCCSLQAAWQVPVLVERAALQVGAPALPAAKASCWQPALAGCSLQAAHAGMAVLWEV